MRSLSIFDTKRSNQRGQRRKLSALLKHIDSFNAFQNIDESFEHFHVPCANFFIESHKTNSKIKTAFCKKWIETTEKFIKQKPTDLPFCKVVCVLCVPYFWDSQIIIFYDENYYSSFWDRKTPEQTWAQIEDARISFTRERGIVTSLKEIGYIEEIKDCPKRNLWYYGEFY